MANINLKYPDGRIEEKELLTAINKDGLNIAVINLNNSVNGNKVTGSSSARGACSIMDIIKI